MEKERKQFFFSKWCWYNWIMYVKECKKWNQSSCIKLMSKCSKNLTINHDLMNLLEEKMGSILECIGKEDDFLNRTAVAHTH